MVGKSSCSTSLTMPSVSVTSLVPMSHFVSSTVESGQYRRDTTPARAAGFSKKLPAPSPPISRPNTGSPSKRGKQSQSIEPAEEQRAAVRVSPISP